LLKKTNHKFSLPADEFFIALNLFFNFDLLLNKRQAHLCITSRRIDYTPDIIFMLD
jgi:hypothetical protein